jgi:hypothetical protein
MIALTRIWAKNITINKIYGRKWGSKNLPIGQTGLPQYTLPGKYIFVWAISASPADTKMFGQNVLTPSWKKYFPNETTRNLIHQYLITASFTSASKQSD